MTKNNIKKESINDYNWLRLSELNWPQDSLRNTQKSMSIINRRGIPMSGHQYLRKIASTNHEMTSSFNTFIVRQSIHLTTQQTLNTANRTRRLIWIGIKVCDDQAQGIHLWRRGGFREGGIPIVSFQEIQDSFSALK